MFIVNDISSCFRIIKTVSQIILHDNYDGSTFMNDIALLKLSSPVDLATYTPVCLPTAGTDYAGKNAWVYGNYVAG